MAGAARLGEEARISPAVLGSATVARSEDGPSERSLKSTARAGLRRTERNSAGRDLPSTLQRVAVDVTSSEAVPARRLSMRLSQGSWSARMASGISREEAARDILAPNEPVKSTWPCCRSVRTSALSFMATGPASAGRSNEPSTTRTVWSGLRRRPSSTNSNRTRVSLMARRTNDEREVSAVLSASLRLLMSE